MHILLTHRAFLNSIIIVLMTLLAYQLSLAIWRTINTEPSLYLAMPQAINSHSKQITKLTQAELVREIIKNNPFGKVEKKQIALVSKTDIQAPETQLNYKLRGIYYSDNQLLSSAIIEINSKDVQSYTLEDEIENGITIHSIKVKHIVLDRYGKYETLSLEEIKFDKANKALRVVSKSNSNVVHNQLLKRYRKRFVSNPMALARKFRSIPVTENGKTIGFRLKAVNGETLLKKLNVPNNAVFTSINGVGLDKPFQALDALKSLQTATSISVTYLVEGNEISRDFEL